jgi:hypothetical protein
MGDAPEPHIVILNTRGTTAAHLRLLQPWLPAALS